VGRQDEKEFGNNLRTSYLRDFPKLGKVLCENFDGMLCAQLADVHRLAVSLA
jgi:hypothetical protein